MHGQRRLPRVQADVSPRGGNVTRRARDDGPADAEFRAADRSGVDERVAGLRHGPAQRSEEHTSELQSLMRISYAVFCLKKKKTDKHNNTITNIQTTKTRQYI